MDSAIKREFEKLWWALRCKASCNSGAGITSDNGVTKTLNNIQLGGDLIQDTEIETDTNDYTKVETISNIKEGIYDNPVSGNRSWNVEHTNNGTTFVVTNKAEGLNDPFSNDIDVSGLIVLGSNGDFSTVSVGVDNNTNEVFSEIMFVSSNVPYAMRLDKNGVRIKMSGLQVLQITPTAQILLPELQQYANDAAAQAAGLPLKGLYIETVTGYLKTRLV